MIYILHTQSWYQSWDDFPVKMTDNFQEMLDYIDQNFPDRKIMKGSDWYIWNPILIWSMTLGGPVMIKPHKDLTFTSKNNFGWGFYYLVWTEDDEIIQEVRDYMNRRKRR